MKSPPDLHPAALAAARQILESGYTWQVEKVAEIIQRETRIQELEGALRFYGDEALYPTGDGSKGPIAIIQDKGRTARAALGEK